jgi:hypothetical protein
VFHVSHLLAGRVCCAAVWPSIFSIRSQATADANVPCYVQAKAISFQKSTRRDPGALVFRTSESMSCSIGMVCSNGLRFSQRSQRLSNRCIYPTLHANQNYLFSPKAARRGPSNPMFHPPKFISCGIGMSSVRRFAIVVVRSSRPPSRSRKNAGQLRTSCSFCSTRAFRSAS